ncbi:MAG: Rpn family recombination-promoting nuclease/putative transposase [candidate division KSB1 bacterium]|nr:Rpn family recombination-promoting nuclease/putative transposase [candidate division KSB1 bacterium]MDZ7303306.1 Rpn family recombination-promoting nuclease/putative transposase [candidate division KSB1 bacterium]MDZ7312608.1 Rpn family recombination-promoting nuclease/putative transposase [candidate division KSB1 bacterium]
MSRFIDPTTDFGFKKIFGEEANKNIIRGFITDVLELEAPILDIHFMDKEQLPDAQEERSGIYDVYCKDAEGNHFIVEMQKNRIPFIKDRMIYYSTFPIAAQARKGGKRATYPEPALEVMSIHDEMETYGGKMTAWDFRLSEVYCIAVLGYALDGSTTAVNRNRIRNDQPPHEAFSDKLQFVTLELPLFDERKPEYSLERRINKWLYFLKYLPELSRIPDFFKGDEVFEKAFEVAKYVNLTLKERRRYELNIKRMRDTYAVLMGSYETGYKKGYDQGYDQGRVEEAQNTLKLIFSHKLGPVSPEIGEAIRTLNVEQIHAILARSNTINDWQTLQQILSTLHEGNTI